MALAPVAYTIFERFLHHNPKNPHWANRDRFVLSNGHASMLLYSMLYLTGYGLTLGVHSRIQSFVDEVVSEARVGNLYVNRSMIGAVVGVQPFGGEGLSGTGPKAGGPHYLARFAVERTLTVNTAAAGGNAALLAQDR